MLERQQGDWRGWKSRSEAEVEEDEITKVAGPDLVNLGGLGVFYSM